MKTRSLGLVLLLTGCGALPSGAGMPENPPASGLGPSVPWSDDTGLSWEAPFILADPAQALSHPSAIAAGDQIDLWVGSLRGGVQKIVHAHASSFAAGFGDTEEVLSASLPWHDAEVSSPAMVRKDGASYLFYLSAGRVGLVKTDASGRSIARALPLYADPGGAPIDSLAAAGLAGDGVRVALLVDQAIVELTIDWTTLDLAAADGGVSLIEEPTAVPLPSWASRFLDVGLRIDRTAAGRLREDLFFAAQLPVAGDLGVQTAPSAIGAAARYLDHDAPRFELVDGPILGGTPAPRGPTSLGYSGGVMLLYSARGGPRDAIGVARHP